MVTLSAASQMSRGKNGREDPRAVQRPDPAPQDARAMALPAGQAPRRQRPAHLRVLTPQTPGPGESPGQCLHRSFHSSVLAPERRPGLLSERRAVSTRGCGGGLWGPGGCVGARWPDPLVAGSSAVQGVGGGPWRKLGALDSTHQGGRVNPSHPVPQFPLGAGGSPCSLRSRSDAPCFPSRGLGPALRPPPEPHAAPQDLGGRQSGSRSARSRLWGEQCGRRGHPESPSSPQPD